MIPRNRRSRVQGRPRRTSWPQRLSQPVRVNGRLSMQREVGHKLDGFRTCQGLLSTHDLDRSEYPYLDLGNLDGLARLTRNHVLRNFDVLHFVHLWLEQAGDVSDLLRWQGLRTHDNVESVGLQGVATQHQPTASVRDGADSEDGASFRERIHRLAGDQDVAASKR